MNNVYGKPEYSGVQAELQEKLEEVRIFYGDSDELNQGHLERYLEYQRSRAR